MSDPVEYVLVADMEGHAHSQYGEGYFCTPDAIRSFQMSDIIDALAPEAMDRAADQFQECGKHRQATEYRVLADRQRALIAKASLPDSTIY